MPIFLGKYAIALKEGEFKDRKGFYHDRWVWPLAKKNGSRDIPVRLCPPSEEKREELLKLRHHIYDVIEEAYNADIYASDMVLDLHSDYCEKLEPMMAHAMFTLDTLLDPKNKIVDPSKSTLDFHPDIKKGRWLMSFLHWIPDTMERLKITPWEAED